MARTPTFRLAQQLLGEDLLSFITSRKASMSWDRVARELWLATDREIDVTGVTVQKWHDEAKTEVA